MMQDVVLSSGGLNISRFKYFCKGKRSLPCAPCSSDQHECQIDWNRQCWKSSDLEAQRFDGMVGFCFCFFFLPGFASRMKQNQLNILWCLFYLFASIPTACLQKIWGQATSRHSKRKKKNPCQVSLSIDDDKCLNKEAFAVPFGRNN